MDVDPTQVTAFSALPLASASFPNNVVILSLKLNALGITACESGDVRVLLRLAHMYEKSEDPELSKDASVTLDTLFDASVLKIKSAYEVLLSGSAFASVQNGQPVAANISHPIVLVPMQIATFELCAATPPAM